MLTGTALAAEPVISEVRETANVTIHVIKGTESTNPGNGAADGNVQGTPVEGATLKYGQIGKVVQYREVKDNAVEVSLKYQITNSTIADKLSIKVNDCIALDQLKTVLNSLSADELKAIATETTGKTGTDGTTTVNGLSGVYLFIGGDMPASVASEISPFFVQAPMPNVDETQDWNTDIHAYPKVTDAGNTTFSKNAYVNDTTNTEVAFVQTGSTIKYVLKAEIPALKNVVGTVEDFTTFEIEDTMATGITYKGDAAVKIGTTTLTATQYEVDRTTNGFKLKLTADGLTELSKYKTDGTTVTVEYTATVANLGVGTANSNTAKLTFDRPITESEQTENIYTHAINLTKTLSETNDTIAAGDVEFKLSSDAQGNSIIYVINNNGIYEVVADETVTDATSKLAVGTNGSLQIKGLGNGTYYLTETKTKSGYTMLGEAIKITINSTETADGIINWGAAVDDTNVTVTNGTISLTVENTKNDVGFTLPSTGGAGTLLVTAAGATLIALAVILLVVSRKKGQQK